FAALLIAAPGLLDGERWLARSWRPAIAAAVGLLGAIAVAAIPPSNSQPAASTNVDLTVLLYNVHQGLDYWTVPSAAALVDCIELAKADVVGLEEVNRGLGLA